MALPSHQTIFCQDFKVAFSEGTQHQQPLVWSGGQNKDNCGRLKHDTFLRRDGICKPVERFELGDLWTDFQSYRIIVEYESAGVSTHNLLKYWPYIRGEMIEQPKLPILLCHFSNWGSWGSHRDLWNWLMRAMGQDQAAKVNFIGKQFDNGHDNPAIRQHGIQQAIAWIIERCEASGQPASADGTILSPIQCQCN